MRLTGIAAYHNKRIVMIHCSMFDLLEQIVAPFYFFLPVIESPLSAVEFGVEVLAHLCDWIHVWFSPGLD